MIASGQTSIGTAAVAIDGVSTNPSRITLQNLDNTDTMFIGGTAVSTTNGLGLLKLETLQIDLGPNEQLYAVSSKTGHSIAWLRQTL